MTFSTSVCLLMVIWIQERKISILAVYFDWNVNWIFFPILNVKTMVFLLIFEEEDRNALYSSAKLQILIFFCWQGLLKMKKTSHPSLYYSSCIHITLSFSNILEICNYIHSFMCLWNSLCCHTDICDGATLYANL